MKRCIVSYLHTHSRILKVYRGHFYRELLLKELLSQNPKTKQKIENNILESLNAMVQYATYDFYSVRIKVILTHIQRNLI